MLRITKGGEYPAASHPKIRMADVRFLNCFRQTQRNLPKLIFRHKASYHGADVSSQLREGAWLPRSFYALDHFSRRSLARRRITLNVLLFSVSAFGLGVRRDPVSRRTKSIDMFTRILPKPTNDFSNYFSNLTPPLRNIRATSLFDI